MDSVSVERARIYQNKALRRKELAALSWPEKVKIVIQMQKMIAPILKDRGIKAIIWREEE